MAEKTAYVYVIEQADDGSYWAYLPDLPGCTTTAPGSRTASRHTADATAGHSG